MNTTQFPSEYRRQAFFESDAVDQLVSMILELATEQWVIRERLYLIERAAEQQGLKLREAIEGYRPSDSERSELTQMRKTMIANLMRTINFEHRHARPKIET